MSIEQNSSKILAILNFIDHQLELFQEKSIDPSTKITREYLENLANDLSAHANEIHKISVQQDVDLDPDVQRRIVMIINLIRSQKSVVERIPEIISPDFWDDLVLAFQSIPKLASLPKNRRRVTKVEKTDTNS